MSFSVYLRPLIPEDALVSYNWRNDPKIWRFTGKRPDKKVTLEMELVWLDDVLKRQDEVRMAICLVEDHRYIGNVYLTEIKDHEAIVHIFIGEKQFWGKNRALDALWLIIVHAFEQLKLENVYGIIKKNNIASMALAKNFGALITNEYYDEEKKDHFVKWKFTRRMYENYPYQMKQSSINSFDNFALRKNSANE